MHAEEQAQPGGSHAHVEQDRDGVAAADSVAVAGQVVAEGTRVSLDHHGMSSRHTAENERAGPATARWISLEHEHEASGRE